MRRVRELNANWVLRDMPPPNRERYGEMPWALSPACHDRVIPLLRMFAELLFAIKFEAQGQRCAMLTEFLDQVDNLYLAGGPRFGRRILGLLRLIGQPLGLASESIGLDLRLQND